MPLQDKQLSAVRARKPKRIPSVHSKSEDLEVIEHLQDTNKLIPQIMYGSGLRDMEMVRMRVFEPCSIYRSRADCGNNIRCWSAPGRSNTPTYPEFVLEVHKQINLLVQPHWGLKSEPETNIGYSSHLLTIQPHNDKFQIAEFGHGERHRMVGRLGSYAQCGSLASGF